MKRFSLRSMLLFFAVIGPGVITAAADNDAGGIMTYVVAGAKYKYDMLCILVIITFVLAMIQEMCARMAVVTQKGLGELIRENFGVKWTMFALGVLLIANLATTVAEFAGLAASTEIFGISRYISVPICAIGIWFLIVKGSFKIVERVFLALTVLYGTYVVSGIMSNPNWLNVFHSVIKPEYTSQNLSPGFLFLVIAVIGTTITPWMQFFLQATVVDKGIKLENYKYQKWDVYIGSLLTDIVSFFIVVSAAVMIYQANGGPVDLKSPAEAAVALKPFAKGYAEALFAIGLFNASLLAAAVLPLSTAYTYCESFGWEIGVSRRLKEAPMFFGIYTLSIIFGAGVVLLPDIGLIDTMINAQAINGILLPIILIFMLKLINSKEIMGKHTNTALYNIAVWGMAIILILMAVGSLIGTILGY